MVNNTFVFLCLLPGVKKVEYLPGTEPCVLLRHTGDIVEVSASMPKAL